MVETVLFQKFKSDQTKQHDGRRQCADEGDHGRRGAATVFFIEDVM